MKIGTIGLVAALMFVGIAMMPAAQAVNTPDPDHIAINGEVLCVSLYQEYPDGSKYWILYRTCVGN